MFGHPRVDGSDKGGLNAALRLQGAVKSAFLL